jgi:8-oxo-dGTP pyrophosphatase MutT (NUDIX family)
MRDEIKKLIEEIKPFDALEKEHILDTIAWIDSGVEIFRIQKPDVPPKHLVSYFVLVDPARKKLLLLDHVKSGLWLPSGGHVEKDEHPKTAVEREIQEELHMSAEFLSENPFFITQAVTVATTKSHRDVSLWYVLKGDSQKEIIYDLGEYTGYHWLGYQEVLDTDIVKLDIHMHRFVNKLLGSDFIIR